MMCSLAAWGMLAGLLVGPVLGQNEGREPPLVPGEALLEVRIVNAPPPELVRQPHESRTFGLSFRSRGKRDPLPGVQWDLVGGSYETVLALPAGEPLTLACSLFAVGRRYRDRPFVLEDGTTSVLEIDLGHEELVELRLVDVPCGELGGREIRNRVRGAIRFPGGNVADSFVTTVDRTSGEGVFRACDPRRGTSRLSGDGLVSIELDGDRTDDHGRPLVRPSAETKLLCAPEGSRLGIGLEYAAAPFRIEALLPDRCHPVTGYSGDRLRVFVDGEPQGLIDRRELEELESTCVELKDVHWLPEIPLVAVSVAGAADDAELVVESVEPSAIERRLGIDERIGAIVPAGKQSSSGATLGWWTRGEDGDLRASIRLPEGRYWIGLETGWNGGIARVDPFVVDARARQDLRLDLGEQRAFRVDLRNAGGGALDRWSRPTSIAIGGADFFIGLHGEESVLVRTFGRLPAMARLAGAPGGVDMEVPLRPATHGENDDLIALVPPVRELDVSIEPVLHGRVTGYTYESYEFEPWLDAILRREIPRTVEAAPGGGVRVHVRGPRAHGVIVELCDSRGTQVRDWFLATGYDVALLSEGEGRFVDVTSRLRRDAQLRLVPTPIAGLDLRPAQTAYLEAGSTTRIWVPRIAERLEWTDWIAPDVVMGGIALDRGDRIVLQ